MKACLNRKGDKMLLAFELSMPGVNSWNGRWTGATARKLRKASAGFCGYDCMVDEIRFHGRIKTLAERTVLNAPREGRGETKRPNAGCQR